MQFSNLSFCTEEAIFLCVSQAFAKFILLLLLRNNNKKAKTVPRVIKKPGSVIIVISLRIKTRSFLR